MLGRQQGGRVSGPFVGLWQPADEVVLIEPVRVGRAAVQGTDDLLTSAVHHLAEHGHTHDDLHAERATLEEVFLTFTDGVSRSESLT